MLEAIVLDCVRIIALLPKVTFVETFEVETKKVKKVSHEEETKT
jgi:hypothetical protein